MTDPTGVVLIKAPAPVDAAAPAAPAESSFLQHVPFALLIIVAVLTALYFVVLGFFKVPDGNMQAFTNAGMLVVGGLGTIIGYYFGSSRQQKSPTAKDS